MLRGLPFGIDQHVVAGFLILILTALTPDEAEEWGGKGIELKLLNYRIPLPPIPLPAVRPWLLNLFQTPRRFFHSVMHATRACL